MEEPSHLAYLAISSIIPLVGLPGNLCLLGFSLRRWKFYHLTSNELLIALLTIFNVIKIGLFLVVSYAAYFIGNWSFGDLICKIVSKSGAISYLMTEFIIVFLVNTHYKIISKNQFFVNVSGKFAICSCSAAFAVSTGMMAIPDFYEWSVISYTSSNDTRTIEVCQVKMEIWLVTILFILLLPAFYCIFVIFMVKDSMRVSLERLRNNLKTSYYQKRATENKRAFTILAMMSFGFSLSHVPLMILHLVEFFSSISHQEQLEHLYSWYTFALFFLSALDTCTTPMAYLIFNPSLRRFLRKGCCCNSQRSIFKRRKVVKFKNKPNSAHSSSTFTLKSTS